MKSEFGIFINKKRIEKQISVRRFAKLIGISAEYLSKIENNLRSAPNDEVLERIATKLLLSTDEKEKLYDLAAESKSSPALASDLLVYIKNNGSIHKALRIAKRCGANEEDWQNFIAVLSKKYL